MSSLYECPSCGCKTFSTDVRCQRCGTPLKSADFNIPDEPDSTVGFPRAGERWRYDLLDKTVLIASVDQEHGVVIWRDVYGSKSDYSSDTIKSFLSGHKPAEIAGDAYPQLGSQWIRLEDKRVGKVVGVNHIDASIRWETESATFLSTLHDFLGDHKPAPAPPGGFGGHEHYIGGLPAPGSVWIDKIGDLTWPGTKVVIQQSDSRGIKFFYPGQDGIYWLPLQAFLQYYVRPDDRPEPAKPADPLGIVPKAGSKWQKIMASQFDVQVTVTRANADYVYFTVDGHVPVTGDDGTRNFHLGRFLKAYKPVLPVKPAIPIRVKMSEEAASKLRNPRKAVSSGLLLWLNQRDAPKPTLDDLLASDFAECPECAAKPGSPVLCQACLQNRALISFMKKELEGRAEDEDLHKPLLFGSEAEEDARMKAEIDWFLKAAEDQAAKDMQTFKDNPGLGAKVAANARELAALGVRGLDRKTQEEILKNGFAAGEPCLHTADNAWLTTSAADSPEHGDEFVVLNERNLAGVVDFWLCVLRVSDDTVWTAERLSNETGWTIIQKSREEFRKRILHVGFGLHHRPFKLNARRVDVTSICRILEESEAKGKREAEEIEAKKRRSDVVDALDYPQRGDEFRDRKAARGAIVVRVELPYVWTCEKHIEGTWQAFKHTLADFAKSWSEAVELVRRDSLVTENHVRMVVELEAKTSPQDAPARPEPSSANYDPSEMSEDEVCERLEAYLKYCSAGLRLRRLARRALGFTKDVKRGEEPAETEPSDWQGRPNG